MWYLKSLLGTRDVSEQGAAESPKERQPYSLPPTVMQNRQILLGGQLWRSVVQLPGPKLDQVVLSLVKLSSAHLQGWTSGL